MLNNYTDRLKTLGMCVRKGKIYCMAHPRAGGSATQKGHKNFHSRGGFYAPESYFISADHAAQMRIMCKCCFYE